MNARTRSFLVTQSTAPLPRTLTEASADARRMCGRFADATERVDRRNRLECHIRAGFRLLIVAGAITLPVTAVMVTNGWPLETTLRHFAAAAGCEAAQAVELAPARRGEPGYWPWLDPDNSGTACAPQK